MIFISKKFLVDWAVQYIKNKDIIAKEIVSIAPDKEGLDVYIETKSGVQAVVVEPFVSDVESILAKLEPFKGKGKLIIVIFNCRDNLDRFLAVWDKLVGFDPKLMLIFANPFSKTDKRWIVFPHVHHQVSEKGSLQRGLLALFESVEPITEAEAKQILENK